MSKITPSAPLQALINAADERANLQRLDEAAKRIFVAKNSLAYKTAKEAIETPGIAISCGKNTGSGRHSSSTSWQSRVAMLLGTAGFNFNAFNDAPKGGKAGDKIVVIEGDRKHTIEAITNPKP